MYNLAHSAPSENPSLLEPLPLQTPPRKKTGKKLYAAVSAIVAIAVIVAALMIPQGAATIPLEVNYVVGEKMVYDINMAMDYNSGNNSLNPSASGYTPSNASLSLPVTIVVEAFDGEYYTLNNTQTTTLGNRSTSFSYLQRMNKTGYSSVAFDFGSRQISVDSLGLGNTCLTELLNRSEVKVGDTWEIPYPFDAVNSSYVSGTGALVMTFRGFEDLTVPAGTYRVFRVEIDSKDLVMHVNIPASNYTSGMQYSAQLAVSGQMNVEYGTLRQIKSTMQETVTMESTI